MVLGNQELSSWVNFIDCDLLDTLHSSEFSSNFGDEIKDTVYHLSHAYKVMLKKELLNDTQNKTIFIALKQLSENLQKIIKEKPFESLDKENFKIELANSNNRLKDSLLPFDYLKPERTVVDYSDTGSKITRICHEILIHGKLYLEGRRNISDEKMSVPSVGMPSNAATEADYLQALQNYQGRIEFVTPQYLTTFLNDVTVNEVSRTDSIKTDDGLMFPPTQVLKDLFRTSMIKFNDTIAFEAAKNPFQNIDLLERPLKVYQLCLDYLKYEKNPDFKRNLLIFFSQGLQLMVTKKILLEFNRMGEYLPKFSLSSIECQDGVNSKEVKLTINIGTAIQRICGEENVKFFKTSLELFLGREELIAGNFKTSRGYIVTSPGLDSEEEMQKYSKKPSLLAYGWAYMSGK